MKSPSKPVLSLALALGASLVAISCTGSPATSPSPSAAVSSGSGASPSAAIASTSATATANGSAHPTTPSAADLKGRVFVSSSIKGHTLAAGTQVRVSFTASQITIQAGCNTIGGGYSITSGKLQLSELQTTEMACDADRMEQDTWITFFLQLSTITLADQSLTLAKDGVTLTLLDRSVAEPDRSLTGTRWVLDGIISGEVVSSVPAGISASLTFADGKVAIDTGCNSGDATAVISGGKIVFSGLGLTTKACGTDTTAVEQSILQVLDGTATWEVVSDTLTLTGAGAGLILKAAG